jgi:hypothetical protein
MTEVIKSRLVFIDSDSTQLDGVGDDFQINFPPGIFSSKSGQFLRLTLQDFHCIKNFYNVNSHNNLVLMSNKYTITNTDVNTDLSLQSLPTEDFDAITLTEGDYNSRGHIANILYQSILGRLNARYNPLGGSHIWEEVGGITPSPAVDEFNGNHKFYMNVEYKTAPNGQGVNHNLDATNLVIQCRDYDTELAVLSSITCNDSYQLLGCKRVATPSTSTQSFSVTFPDSTSVKIEGYYPMQRFTTEHLYLRTDKSSDNYATNHFSRNNSLHLLNLTGTDIMAKMPIQDEIVSYSDQQSVGGYFIDIAEDRLTQLKLKLTDSKGRAIPSAGPDQKSLGNFDFTMCLRVDVLSYGDSQYPPLGPPPPQNIKTDTYRFDIGQGQRYFG